jgi:cytochrome o ubiquinol oxidase subunit II
MNKKLKIILIACSLAALALAIGLTIWYVSNHNMGILNPKGVVAEEQRSLLINATLLMAIIVVPVLALVFGIAWRYREGNKKAAYSPNLSGSKIAEAIWWLIPLVIVVFLGVMAYTSSHSLDPYRPLTSTKQPIKVQVIALQWKWLFLYPEQQVASVNYLPIPSDTPIEFTITSDAPMNSFWIPQLGGQVYAMAGMSTKLHLQASQDGTYRGSSANLSGEGFAGMTFDAHAMPRAEFDAWVTNTRNTTALTTDIYNELAKPSNVAPASYAFPSTHSGLYDTVIMKYMKPHSEGH